MAFLDNSGDIILDAVLTDSGRKRMARGNFKIVKFALGDDEIDYGLYNKNHPSGSAYYDLEVLQTPILEAFTQANASLNYGLVSYARNDLLYLPTIVLNTKNTASGMSNVVVKHPTKNVIFLSNDNKTNSTSKVTGDMLYEDISNRDNILSSNSTDDKFIFIETGLNGTDAPLSTSSNQNTYLLSVGLNDNKFAVQCDKRFIGSVLGATPGALFTLGAKGTPTLSMPLASKTATTSAKGIKNFKEVLIEGITSRLYPSTTGDDTTSTYSSISGARGAFTGLNFEVNPNISQNDFSKFGRTAYALFDTSNLYDYIDTIVYVRGINTNIVLQLPIRIIQASQS
tara:strand:+ start:1926 stop:2948 length:1023 start_codon:yes stop_codon:yes gene_type:complete